MKNKNTKWQHISAAFVHICKCAQNTTLQKHVKGEILVILNEIVLEGFGPWRDLNPWY